MSKLRLVCRVFSWVTLAGAVLTLTLILHKSRPLQVQTDPQATARMESKLQQLGAAATSGQPQALRLDEAELNTYLRSNLALRVDPALATPAQAAPVDAPPNTAAKQPTVEELQSSVRDFRINLTDDRVHAYLVFDFHGKDLSLDLEGRLGVENGYLRFEPTSGQIGSLPLPQSALQNAVRRMLDSPENREKLRLPADIRDLRIENGEVVVSYK